MVTEGRETPRATRRPRWWWWLIALGVVALGMIVFAIGATVWEFSNSTAFCGTTCHTMPPEYVAYMRSPHARVSCVDCHLGQEGILSAIPMKLKEYRHGIDALTKEYETPIYVKSMRPARFTCEQCHFPEKFSTDRVREIRHYQTDPENTEIRIWLMMKTGGGTQREGLGKGIHWHIENEVWFLATDRLQQEIPYVRQIDLNGTVTEYFDAESGIPADLVAKESGKLKRMDCIDCHNRISHQFRSPERILDQALERRLISRDIPRIKEMGLALLEKEYASQADAMDAIEQLATWYETTYPDFYAEHQDDIAQAVQQLKEGYKSSVFPDMDVGWQTHPDNIGHTDFPGCFRCHDGKHISPENTVIRLECNICHTIPEVYQEGDQPPVIHLEKIQEPESHRNSHWISQHRFTFDETCALCHDVSNPGGSDNTSFCSNSACHAREWEFVGLDAPKIRELSAPPRVSSSGVAKAIPHPIGERTDCAICHDPDKVLPAPDSHADFGVDSCTGCHEPTLKETGEVVGDTVAGRSPAIPHALIGRENCLECHDPENGLKPAPEDHMGRTSGSCRVCHTQLSATPSPKPREAASGSALAIPHALEGRENCLLCHNPGGVIKPAPENHIGRTQETCQACHNPVSPGPGEGARPTPTPTESALPTVETVTATPSADLTPSEIAPAQATPTITVTATSKSPATLAPPDAGSGEAPVIAHELEGRDDCLLCHAPGTGLKPAPEDHAGRTVDSCQACHKPAG